MPTYEFRCPDGTIVERVFKMSDVPAEIPAPDGSGMAVRIVSAGAGLHFKGSGFYITDYGKDGKKDQRAQSDKATSDAAKGDSGPSDAGKPDAGKPDAGKSDGGKADGAKGESAKSDSAKSDSAKSDSAKSSSAASGTGKSDSAPAKKEAPSAPAAPKSDTK